MVTNQIILPPYLIEKIKSGTLTCEDVGYKDLDYSFIFDIDAPIGNGILRQKIVKTCSWWLMTKNWIDWVKTVTEGKQVLELCAGYGWLGNLLDNWVCTDIAPKSPWVEKLNVTNAIKSIDHDILFLAWPPYKSRFDCMAARTGKPLILIGESGGGCTGSTKLWKEFNPILAIDLYEFGDIPNWFGLHDRTWLVNWK